MITYKYKLYQTKKTKQLDAMLREASFVWNHAIALHKRYYSLFGKYISKHAMQKHYAKRIKRNLLHSQTTQEILERVDTAYQRFFKKLAKRPPKFKKATDFSSIVYTQGGFALNGNVLTVNTIEKRFKFSYSRPYNGKVKRIIIKRSRLGEYYLIIITDAEPKAYEKSHNGASVGIDFGLKTYMVMSDGITVKNPQFLKCDIDKIRRKSCSISKCNKGSNNRQRRRKDLCREFEKITNKREDFQWKLAHSLCRKYDYIFIEDLSLVGMTKMWGRKMSDLAHGEFVGKLEYVARKYGVTVHKIDRFYPSSKTCECGYVNKELKLSDREWVCPVCGKVNNRDLNAAENILRRGISELWSGCKTEYNSAIHACTQESHAVRRGEYVNKLVDDIHVGLISYKLYGDKNKPKKPKTLKNTKQTWTTKIIGRSASFFEMGDEIYIKMGELFCPLMGFPEPKDMMLPLSALAKKYPHKFAKIGNRDKFVYPDAWCTIMELNTGWLRITGLTKALSYDVCLINYSAIVSKLYGELFSISQTHEKFYHLDECGNDFYSAAYYRFCDAIVNHYYHQLLKD